MKIRKIKLNFDWTIVVIPILLSIAGLSAVYSITSIAGKSDQFFSQILFIVLSIFIYIFFSILDYNELKHYKWYIYAVVVTLIFAVDFLGQEILGSRRWINIGFTQIQPSEMMKFAFLILSAGLISQNERLSIKKTLFILFFAIVPIFLVLKQPDLGTALTLSSIVIAVLVAGRAPRSFYFVAIGLLILISPIVFQQLKPYQKQRVATFLNPASDPLGSGYNVTQSKIAVGSGGLYGRGFGEATQSQLQFLPVAQIDFIFSGWAEMTGFVGSILMVLAYTILIWRIFSISGVSKDTFGEVFCIGAATMIFFQSFVNIGMNIGVMPVTGIPLPFVSYGGTSIATTAAILGVVQGIYLRRKTLKFE